MTNDQFIDLYGKILSGMYANVKLYPGTESTESMAEKAYIAARQAQLTFDDAQAREQEIADEQDADV